MTGERTVDGFSALTLSTREAGGIEAAFVPGAGMVGCSLRHRGEELLGQRRGLRAYVAERIVGDPAAVPVGEPARADAVLGRRPRGRPRLGVAAAATGRQRAADPRAARRRARVARGAPRGVGDGGVLAARFEFGADDGLTAAFPFPHELALEVELRGPALTITTTVRATATARCRSRSASIPTCACPASTAATGRSRCRSASGCASTTRMLPTGEREPVTVPSGPLGSRTFDDGYVAPEGSAPFVLAGGGRRIELAFLSGFPYAQVFAPAEDDVVAFEPMTAPTNALVSGGPELPLLGRATATARRSRSRSPELR